MTLVDGIVCTVDRLSMRELLKVPSEDSCHERGQA